MQTDFAPAVGFKFHEDGSVRPFAGNTFLCHVRHDDPVYQEVIWAQQQLQAMSCSKHYAFLPQSSFHMTVFEGLCDQVREPALWSAKLPLDMPLEQTTAELQTLLQAAAATPRFEMVFDSVYNSSNGGTLLRLKPANPETVQALKTCRDQLSALTGIRHAVHDSYHFHITLSYKVRHLDNTQEQELAETCQRIAERMHERFGLLRHDAVEFCTFDNMFEFNPVAHLLLLTD